MHGIEWQGLVGGSKVVQREYKSIYFSLMIISGSCHDGQSLKSYHC